LKVLAGDIDVQGLGGNAIYAGTYNGSIDIQVFGAVKTGATGGDAIYLRPDGNTTTTVAVKTNASVKASAAQADGMYISGIGGGLLATNTITIDGIVEATGTQSRGIVAGGINDKVTVNLGGSVSGVDAGIRLQETGGDAKVTNAGTVTGSGGLAVEFLGTSTATFDNDGTVSGNVNMYSGNDTVILRSNSAVTGNIDGKGGTDKLELTGAGTTSSLDTATILNFENGEKTGTGKWALTGTNASFASTFDVNGGLLAANATLANTAFTVASGATLGGTGTLKSVTVSSGGKLAPGNSIGTLHVSTATYDAGAIYEVEVAPDVTPGAFLADNLIVDGTATIDSDAVVHVLVTAGTYNDGDRQQILSAATRTGTFSSTVVDNSAFVDFTLDQSIDGEVWLEVMNVAALPDVAETPNQIAAAEGIDEQGPGFPLFDAIIPLDADTARHAFDLASGEVHATVVGVVLEDSRFIREAVLARLDDAFGNSAQGGAGADAPALELVPRATAWGQVFGSDGSAEGDGNAASYTRSIGGFFAGIDTGEPGAWRVGLAAGHSGAGLSVPDRSSSATIDSYEIAAYGGVESGAVALRLGGAYASGTVGTVRDVTFPGYSETLTASYGVRTAQAFGEVAYRGHVGAIGFEPFANAAYVSSATDGFSETGGSAALSGAPEHRSMTLASFGARFSGTMPALQAHMTALIAWQHRWGDVAPTANVAFAGGTPFSVAGTPRRRDSVRVEAGLDWDIGRRSNFSIAYTGQVAAGGSDHGAKARFSIRF
jgi:outer membrane autotransporter protein